MIKTVLNFIRQNPENSTINLPKNGKKLIAIMTANSLEFLMLLIFVFNWFCSSFAGVKIL
jgi:hypothetical protein